MTDNLRADRSRVCRRARSLGALACSSSSPAWCRASATSPTTLARSGKSTRTPAGPKKDRSSLAHAGARVTPAPSARAPRCFARDCRLRPPRTATTLARCRSPLATRETASRGAGLRGSPRRSLRRRRASLRRAIPICVGPPPPRLRRDPAVARCVRYARRRGPSGIARAIRLTRRGFGDTRSVPLKSAAAGSPSRRASRSCRRLPVAASGRSASAGVRTKSGGRSAEGR